MSVLATSRYASAKITRVYVADGVRSPAIFAMPPPNAVFDFAGYVVREGDRLDYLAYAHYGDSSLWNVIADANPELDGVEPLIAGTVLRIPGVVR